MTTVTITRVDGAQDVLEIAEGVTRFDWVRMLHIGGGYWTADHKVFVPFSQVKIFTVSVSE